MSLIVDLEIGDIILVGKFKNKQIEVKEFGINEKGQPTVNGRSLLAFRIKKLMPEGKKMKKSELRKLIKEMINEGMPKNIFKTASVRIGDMITGKDGAEYKIKDVFITSVFSKTPNIEITYDWKTQDGKKGTETVSVGNFVNKVKS